ncbi:MAG: HEAT repeat domain-containing protein [Pirellulales bacterium]
MIEAGQTRRLAALTVVPLAVLAIWTSPCWGQGAVAPLMRLLKSGSLPAERLPNVVEMVCKRGEADDLQYIYEQVVDPQGFSGELRLKALEGLAAAAETRKVRPTGLLEGLAGLLDDDPATRLAAVRLAGAWRLESLAERLRELAISDDSDEVLAKAALDALVQIGEPAARPVIERLLADRPAARRFQAVAALAKLNPDEAASRAAEVLEHSGTADPAPLIAAFLGQQGGSERLAAALAARRPPADVAKLSLRAMYALGRGDQVLVDVLTEAAGITAEPRALTPDEVQKLAAEVTASGDPARGEDIFRRSELNCFKCHAVSGAGGDVGPDLSAVGATSPVDYVINSLLFPDLAIKEAFVTRIVTTVEGNIFQGIVLDRDETRLVLKDATGQSVTVPVADIDEEQEGSSLMPKGITNFLTQQEFLDLARFVSELGKPGPYGIRSVPTIQRWRLLSEVPSALDRSSGDDATSPSELPRHPSAWQPVCAKVAGMLPLDELVTSDRDILWLRADVDVTAPGALQLNLSSTAGIRAWIDGQPLKSDSTSSDLSRGMHEVLLRVDTRRAESAELRVIVDKAPASTVEYTVVGGP